MVAVRFDGIIQSKQGSVFRRASFPRFFYSVHWGAVARALGAVLLIVCVVKGFWWHSAIAPTKQATFHQVPGHLQQLSSPNRPTTEQQPESKPIRKSGPSFGSVQLPVNPKNSIPAVAWGLMRKCPAHSPGLVFAPQSPKRKYCFGAATIKGDRQCDLSQPDFAQPLSAGTDWISYELREQTYLIHPFYHTSSITLAGNTVEPSDRRNAQKLITLVTQGSWNRLNYVQPLARRWQGPVSVALLLDDPQQLPDLEMYVRSHPLVQKYVDVHVVLRLQKKKAPVSGCGRSLGSVYVEAGRQLGLGEHINYVTTSGNEYLYMCYRTCVAHGQHSAECNKANTVCSGNETMGDPKAQMQNLKDAIANIKGDLAVHPSCPLRDDHYPVNMLRNVALQNAATGWGMVVDIDNVPSACMAHTLQSTLAAERYIQEISQDRKGSTCPGLLAFIPPAVEMSRSDLDNLRVDTDETGCEAIPKPEIVSALRARRAQPMHLYFPAAYMPTNHQRWMDITEDAVQEVSYSTRFEPYYVARLPMPSFDNSFVDRGGNFAQQVLELHASGYRFFVLPNQFIVDIPHSTSTPRQQADNQRLTNALWKNFFLGVGAKYGVPLPPYKGPEYRAMRAHLDRLVSDFDAMNPKRQTGGNAESGTQENVD